MKKRLFLMGKAYDMQSTPIADVERDINAQLSDRTWLYFYA